MVNRVPGPVDSRVKPSTSRVVQSVITTLATQSAPTTALPADTSIPQITEGTEILTRTITPTNTNNRLVIDAVIQCAGGNPGVVALFQDATAGALSACVTDNPGGVMAQTAVLRFEMAAGTTSATTFRVRVGSADGATNPFMVNRSIDTATVFGGTMMLSSLRVTEIAV